MATQMKSASPALAEVIDHMVVEGAPELYQKKEEQKVRCYACGHRCLIFDGQRGVCKVRYNRGGQLYVPHGYVGALQCDPIEKKPFFHVRPGSDILTFGMLGCDYHCAYCQNWVTSQSLRDSTAGVEPMPVSAEQLVDMAQRRGSRMLASSYNEPLITSEWAVEVFDAARRRGLLTGYISNGNGTPEVLNYLRPHIDFYKVDLKSMSDANYRRLGGKLETVLDTIGRLHALGLWVEIVTLLIPGFNDSESELQSAAKFLAGVSNAIPWHVTAFHKDYKMTDPDNTTPAALKRAAQIGRDQGLQFVYAGNLPGRVGDLEHTYCPACSELLVERFGFQVLKYRIKDGGCPKCGTKIPGIWN
ncbi:MAG TPA: AmmeMemoRadiSam system radical SAM enzyme [Acidobacteriota bacterium]|jgi:pyruvate formate lyase activating enzyme